MRLAEVMVGIHDMHMMMIDANDLTSIHKEASGTIEDLLATLYFQASFRSCEEINHAASNRPMNVLLCCLPLRLWFQSFKLMANGYHAIP